MRSQVVSPKTGLVLISLVFLPLALGACGKPNFADVAKGKWQVDKAEVAAVRAIIASAKGLDPKKVKAFEGRSECFYDCRHVVVAGGHIVELRFDKAGVTKIDTLGALKKLRRATFTANDIPAVAGVCGASAMTRLELAGNKIKTFVSGAGCSALNTLELSKNELTLVELSGMPKLRRLSLDKNALAQAKFEGLTVLTQLDLSKQRLTVPPTFEAMPALRTLDLSRNGLTTLTGFRRLPALGILDLGYNKLRSLEGVAVLPALSMLTAQNNQLTRLGIEGPLPRLSTLNVNDNKLKALDSMERLPYLSRVYAKGNQIESLAPLAHVRLLNWLNVNDNRISSLATLSAGNTVLPAEAGARVEGGSVSPAAARRARAMRRRGSRASAGLPPAKRHTFLKTLSARNNGLQNLDGIEQMPFLKTLNVGKNKLTTIAGVEKLRLLEELIVDHNQLTTLAAVKAAPRLKVLIANDNQLKDPDELFGPNRRRLAYTHYDLRHNLYTGVAAGLLFYGLTRTGGYVMGGYGRRRYGGYGVRSGSYRSRYGSSGGYRYGK